jgi:hypothetical protein
MPKQQVKANQKLLRGVQPNAGIERAYYKRLDDLVKQMTNSFNYWFKIWYKADPPTSKIALDATPVREMLAKLKKLGNYWISKFSDAAFVLAPKFTVSVLKDSDNSFQNSLKDAGFGVKFQMTRAQQDAMAAVIEENVNLITSIPKEYLSDVTSIVSTGFSMGRNQSYIYDQLTTKYGVESRRAKFIARDQTEKATAAFTRLRQVELGIEKAMWVHSGAGRHPRPDHVAANGKIYDPKKGCLISGKYILPGELPNCRCFSKPIIEV